MGKKQIIKIGVGGYYSKIRKVKAYDQQLFDREDMQDTELEFEGRIFRDLHEDGFVHGTAISRGLFLLELKDYGPVLFFSCSIFIKEQSFSFQLINYHGLKNINRRNPYGLEEKNRSFYLIIAYKLPFN